MKCGGSSSCIGLADERSDLGKSLRGRVDTDSVSSVELSEFFDAFTSYSSILVVETLFEDRCEDLAERVDRTNRFEDRSNALSNRFFPISDLELKA